MSMENYAQFAGGQPDGVPGQQPAQNGGAPIQSNDQSGAQQMQFVPQDGQGMNAPSTPSEGKTTLW